MKLFTQVLCLFSVLLITSCGWFEWGSWRYKLTVEIETPEGIKSGSAVRQVNAYTNIAKWVNPGVRAISYDVKGEAVVIDLGERGVVFALINWSSYQDVLNAFPKPKGEKTIPYYRSLKPGMRADLLDVRARPKLVTFTELDDANSIKAVPYGEMNKVFHDDIRLHSILIEITRSPVTWGGVDEWLPSGYGKLDIGRYKFKQEK